MSNKKIIEKHLKEILKFIEVDPKVSVVEKEDGVTVEIKGSDLNFLIGYRGESLDALQYILTQAVFRETGVWTPLSVDINGYKENKLEKIDEMVKGFIDRVRFHQKELRLPPLSAFERKHVHTLVADYIDVASESRGDGNDRRLYLVPKK